MTAQTAGARTTSRAALTALTPVDGVADAGDEPVLPAIDDLDGPVALDDVAETTTALTFVLVMPVMYVAKSGYV